MNTQSITLDVSKKPAIMPTLRIGQGDKNGTIIEATIYDNGSPLSLSGYSVRFEMRLPDGTSYYQSPSGTISGNVATIPIDETYAGAVDGVTNIAYIVVCSGSVECSTSRVNVIVLESAEEGADAAHAYSSGIIEATNAANVAAASATSAAGSATTAAANADAKAGLADSAATAANSAASAAGAAAANASTAAAAADAAREAIQGDLAAKADKDGYYPLLSAGTSDALLSGDSTAGTFARRVSDHDGACRIESLRGRTVVWNQLINSVSDLEADGIRTGYDATRNQFFITNVSRTTNYSAGSYRGALGVNLVQGHKYLVGGDGETGIGVSSSTGRNNTNSVGTIFTAEYNIDSAMRVSYQYDFVTKHPVGNTYYFTMMLFDLTLMFGAGNEPATVEEFEARFPEAYYPYNAGELLSVNIEGVKAVGFNQWDEEWENGGYNNRDGSPTTNLNYIRTKNPIPVFPNTQYYLKGGTYYVYFYDEDDGYITYKAGQLNTTITTPSNARLMRFCDVSHSTYNHEICINISNPALNGTYRPYAEQTREIPTSTYFPDGMRSAGTAYDELTKDKAVTRIGAVDLGTLTWAYNNDTNHKFFSASLTDGKPPTGGSALPNIICAKYQVDNTTNIYNNVTDKTIGFHTAQVKLWVYDSAYTDAATFKAAMNGVMLYYELATPTETAIDPPLNMSYPVETGGTESIVIPTGEQSAPPTLVTVYAYDADGIVDKSQSIVAPVEGARASANYSVGSYLVQSGTLYRVTTAIATGETINPGSNVTATTVMAEIIRLTA